jgi:UDPglucose--hexose-1-phosphate uridylyltransferase
VVSNDRRGVHLNLTEDPHRRLNPLTGEWILVSPHRAGRPWQGQIEKLSAQAQPEYDPTCYLCPGNSRAGGVKNPRYSETFVFENDFAALKPATLGNRADLDNRGLLVAEGESGVCRVICFSPRHDLTLATMKPQNIENVIQTWSAQFSELGAMPQINHVQIFENRGAMMGASNPHPHCQVWATSSIPDIPKKELAFQTSYFEQHNKCLLCDYTSLEIQEKTRVVWMNDGFVAIVPFWAVWPFEVMVCSRRHLGAFPEFTQQEVLHLAEMLQRLSSTYDKVFAVKFPYSMGFHQSPTDGNRHPEWHFHAHFYPPLLRSATIRKFMVGFEMLGMPQRDISPESAAEHLRSLCDQD